MDDPKKALGHLWKTLYCLLQFLPCDHSPIFSHLDPTPKLGLQVVFHQNIIMIFPRGRKI